MEKIGGMNIWAENLLDYAVCPSESLCSAAFQINGFVSNM